MYQQRFALCWPKSSFGFSMHCDRRRQWHPLQCSCLENPRDGGAWWLPPMGLHRVGHDWSDLAVAAYTVTGKAKQAFSTTRSVAGFVQGLGLLWKDKARRTCPLPCLTLVLTRFLSTPSCVSLYFSTHIIFREFLIHLTAVTQNLDLRMRVCQAASVLSNSLRPYGL